MANILIIEDDEDTRQVLKNALAAKKHEVSGAASGAEALELTSVVTFDAVILDRVLGDMDGLVVLEKLKSEDQGLPVIMMTGHADIQSAVKAMKLGAVEYLVKPVSNEELLLIIEKAVKERRFLMEFEALKSHIFNTAGPGETVVGESREIKNIANMAAQVAASDLTVILSGPSGSGKEIWARRIHRLSSRNKNPFVALDCGALPENLVESELFGYEKGAFTGADRKKVGLFEAAFGGTLFLDEISNLNFSTQAKLLRVLEERKIRHLGGKKDIPVDVRIIVATNKDLQAAIREGAFREDLFHRLNQFTIALPGLAARKEDIPALALAFLAEAGKTLKKSITGISESAMEIIKAYSWPGNVRELKNVITRGALLAEKEILPHHLGLESAAAAALSGVETAEYELKDLDLKKSVKSFVAEVEKKLIKQALLKTSGNKLRAARLLGIDRKALYNKIHAHKIDM
ncbi:MAG: sigma-54-dependent Fis family transcriptional regulator [Elusimicrobia bacterium]|nr:sigma-54-dependent Fis family transcriptional regulator [Elusimicrobiota bacterium]